MSELHSFVIQFLFSMFPMQPTLVIFKSGVTKAEYSCFGAFSVVPLHGKLHWRENELALK